jgi:hypothetical protein
MFSIAFKIACNICNEEVQKQIYGHILSCDSAHKLAHNIAHRRAETMPFYLTEYLRHYQVEYAYIYSGMKRNFEKYYIEEFTRLARHSDTLCPVHKRSAHWSQ